MEEGGGGVVLEDGGTEGKEGGMCALNLSQVGGDCLRRRRERISSAYVTTVFVDQGLLTSTALPFSPPSSPLLITL